MIKSCRFAILFLSLLFLGMALQLSAQDSLGLVPDTLQTISDTTKAQQIIDDELKRYKKDLADQLRIVEDDTFMRLERLLVGKVPARRGVTDPQLAAKFPQGDIFHPAAFQGLLRRLQQSLAEMAMVIRTGERLHGQELRGFKQKMQHVSVDNIVSNGDILRHRS